MTARPQRKLVCNHATAIPATEDSLLCMEIVQCCVTSAAVGGSTIMTVKAPVSLSLSVPAFCTTNTLALLLYITGQERFRALTSTFYRGAVGIIFGE